MHILEFQFSHVVWHTGSGPYLPMHIDRAVFSQVNIAKGSFLLAHRHLFLETFFLLAAFGFFFYTIAIFLVFRFQFSYICVCLAESLAFFLPMHIDRIASYMVSIPSSCAHAPPHIDNKKQLDSLLGISCIYPCPVLLLFFNFVLKIRHLTCFSVTVDNIGKFLLTEPEHIRVTRSFVMGI